MRARTSGKSVLDTLAALCTETEERIKRIRETLAPTPETQSVFTAFMIFPADPIPVQSVCPGYASTSLIRTTGHA
ncbi:hypothetical protein NM688_g5735 [Phlebia brevispora]|uniref:Uncharacterized protein n=1 Tax=Phlebia brevispora TaxID=194682 RepID=A0ACC1SQN3_9APHY|nr:hypothetical protein NM688_g5735 [Phlebia brevispora]